MSKILTSIAFIAGIGFFAVIIFWPAGTIDWLDGWLYLGIVTAYQLITVVYLTQVNPELIEHRLKFTGISKGTKRWDKFWLALFTCKL